MLGTRTTKRAMVAVATIVRNSLVVALLSENIWFIISPSVFMLGYLLIDNLIESLNIKMKNDS